MSIVVAHTVPLSSKANIAEIKQFLCFNVSAASHGAVTRALQPALLSARPSTPCRTLSKRQRNNWRQTQAALDVAELAMTPLLANDTGIRSANMLSLIHVGGAAASPLTMCGRGDSSWTTPIHSIEWDRQQGRTGVKLVGTSMLMGSNVRWERRYVEFHTSTTSSMYHSLSPYSHTHRHSTAATCRRSMLLSSLSYSFGNHCLRRPRLQRDPRPP